MRLTHGVLAEAHTERAPWRDRVGRLRSGPRKGAVMKHISPAQRLCGGAPTSKVELLGLGKQH
jgi:hypothetical protein